MKDTVQFINIDVEVFGAANRDVIAEALGDRVDVLHNGVDRLGKSILAFELSVAQPRFHATLTELVGLVRALPDDARAAWNGAHRRVFSIGIQAGLGPHATSWSLSPEQMAALVDINAELGWTVYGAATT